MTAISHRLKAEQLGAPCDPAAFAFRSTAELTPLDGLIGQERALDATAFGIGMPNTGYNLFVLGLPATGKATSMRRFLDGTAAGRGTPSDWCYVHFEQQYEEVDGDSASAAELYALLSSLADIPLAQGIAVTGSVNQRGEIQPVGGTNEKIEGFFDACQRQGLTGRQGVLIPEANVRHLMLREDVADSVRREAFHVYAVKNVDEGLAVLSGREAGERAADGTYPPGSFNAAVRQALLQNIERLKAMRQPPMLSAPGG